MTFTFFIFNDLFTYLLVDAVRLASRASDIGRICSFRKNADGGTSSTENELAEFSASGSQIPDQNNTTTTSTTTQAAPYNDRRTSGSETTVTVIVEASPVISSIFTSRLSQLSQSLLLQALLSLILLVCARKVTMPISDMLIVLLLTDRGTSGSEAADTATGEASPGPSNINPLSPTDQHSVSESVGRNLPQSGTTPIHIPPTREHMHQCNVLISAGLGLRC